ncbi:MAG: GNAT family N-acetyltransferase [Methanoregula sp.]|jgi:ribosomal protein S18 acetylase RimI-like enzyme|uniref:GNAT family N-acetyltransferase n=1 Tax=Methanoregula sp. TaxID=2052170 RepID=UPI003D11286B
MRAEPDPWLESVFGHEVFRVTGCGPFGDPGGIPAPAAGKQSFSYAKVPVDDPDLLHALLEKGFRIVDVNVVLERAPERDGTWSTGRYVLREAFPGESMQVQEIAGTCFTHSRFHQDPRIPSEMANLIKRKWVENYFRGTHGEKIIVAAIDGSPIGFLAIAKVPEGGRTVRVIDLIGIHPGFQGTGAGRQLVRYFIDDSVGQCELLRVGTQLVNLPSLRLYEKAGFIIAGASYVLHAHLP